MSQNLTEENISQEIAYFNQTSRKSFERTYGWAWLLKLSEELRSWDDSDGQRWHNNLKPLAELLVEKYSDFLPRQDYPIRTGVHPNTAFGIAFALDFANYGDNGDYLSFKELLIERALNYYINDQNVPADWEPGGEDFFSATLLEADLMSRVLDTSEYVEWLEKFLPDLQNRKDLPILVPVEVSDRTDPKIVHLDGLNLSRAWCMKGISNSLPDQHPYKVLFTKSATTHATEALKNITSGNYEGEHWLASFAVYLLSK